MASALKVVLLENPCGWPRRPGRFHSYDSPRPPAKPAAGDEGETHEHSQCDQAGQPEHRDRRPSRSATDAYPAGLHRRPDRADGAGPMNQAIPQAWQASKRVLLKLTPSKTSSWDHAKLASGVY